MTSVGDLIDRTITQWLEPGRRHAMSKLSVTVTTTSPTITLSYALGVSRGNVMSIEGEQVLVWAYDPTNLQVTDCIRGYESTLPAQHAAGALVQLNTRFPRNRILQALLDEINGWGADLYRIVSFSLSGVANQTWLDLSTTPPITSCYGIVEARIRRNNVGVVEAITSQYDRWPRLGNTKLARDMPTSNFPSGLALKLGEILQGPANVRVTVAMPFNTLSFTESTDLSLIGLPDSYADVACLGAACRLMWGQEADRSDRSSAGEARRAQEVTVGQTYQQGSMLEKTYLRRLDSEKAKLASQYPIRIM